MASKTADILIVDDTPANLTVLSSILSQQGHQVRPAINGDLAIKAACSAPPDLILLDIRMPELNGYEVCRILKQQDNTHHVPVIFISALDDIDDKIKAFEVGGVDYITKPFHIEEVLARVDTQLMLLWQRRQIEALSDQKDQMISIVSHDLVFPLDVLTQSLRLLSNLEAEREHPEARDTIDLSLETVGRMKELVDNLLDLSRIEAGMELVLAPIALSDLLADATRLLRVSAERKGIRLTIDLPDITLRLDARRMGQVFGNLVSNAIKYTPEGGQIRLSAETKLDQVHIRIEDTGLGIPAADLPHIFERFYRVGTPAHRSAKGTGLGLTIVKTIVEQHGGRVWAESQLAQGSTFIVALPL